jgi:hypothetical protein
MQNATTRQKHAGKNRNQLLGAFPEFGDAD